MKLLTIEAGANGAAAAELDDGSLLELARAAAALPDAEPVPDQLTAILAADALDTVRRLVDLAEGQANRERLDQAGAVHAPDKTRLHAPIPSPSLILSQGLAYRRHLDEMGAPAPAEPTAFVKAASSVTGSGHNIILPADHPDMVDFEGEFTIVFGRICHNVEPDEAMDTVAGYTIVNDVSARDWVAAAMNPDQSTLEAAMSWITNIQGKQFPTFTPMGPVIVTADEIPDPHDLRVTTRLNGEVMQDAHTGDLIFSIPRIISHFSQWYLFRPGDILTTGSPAGVGYGRDPKIFMRDGDRIEVSVEKIGTLENTVKNSA